MNTLHNYKKHVESYESYENVPLVYAILAYLSFLILHILGRFQEFLKSINIIKVEILESKHTKLFVPLYSSFEAFYTRYIYRRVQDCWHRPICSEPGVEINIIEREFKNSNFSFSFSGKTRKAWNFGSYNYLGFGTAIGRSIDESADAARKFGLGMASSRQEAGSLALHRELEEVVAEFVGQEAAIAFSMGFATNSLNLPCLVNKFEHDQGNILKESGLSLLHVEMEPSKFVLANAVYRGAIMDCCVISDELNHTSLILGCRLSGATIKKFKHNDMESLEQILENAVVYGQPRTHRPFKKILIVVEGIYSMEGSIIDLPAVIALKKKFKAYLYLDEAHSIGALGPNGKGVVDYFGADPRDIDVAMGTFTKSFGASGGYIAGSKRLIDYLRSMSHSAVYGGCMPAPIAQQIITVTRIIMGQLLPGDGRNRLQKLAENTKYFRARLHQMGLIVYGNRDSPVVPVIISFPASVAVFSRRCLELGLATVVVGFPATSLLYSRARFCISSAHTKEILDKALDIIETVSDEASIKFSRKPVPNWALEILNKEEKIKAEKTNGFWALHNGALDHKTMKVKNRVLKMIY